MCQTLGLQEAVAASPRRVRALTIVEDGALHLVPFCALRYTDGGQRQYLIERMSINVDTLSAPRRRARAGQGKAVIGCYEGAERPLPRARPASDEAAERLRRTWHMTADRVDRRSRCVADLPEAEVFYYFGHGHFTPGAPALSGIEFQGDAGNEIFSIDDIDALRLSGLQQAVVLACHSADAVPYSGRWVVGLPQMLMRRGARSVLAAMWETDPQVSEQVSNEFISLAARIGRAEALRQAQLRVLRSGPTADPFWWAALCVYGEGGRPVVRARRSWRL
jgi:CHAT domain-containing protein